eukprot:850554-Amphidinium_carterae.1
MQAGANKARTVPERIAAVVVAAAAVAVAAAVPAVAVAASAAVVASAFASAAVAAGPNLQWSTGFPRSLPPMYRIREPDETQERPLHTFIQVHVHVEYLASSAAAAAASSAAVAAAGQHPPGFAGPHTKEHHRCCKAKETNASYAQSADLAVAAIVASAFPAGGSACPDDFRERHKPAKLHLHTHGG